MKLKAKENKTWREIEYFNVAWKDRIKVMSYNIEPNETILDLGCGKMWLREFIPTSCRYIPVDYKKRDKNCIVCDFNKYEFPIIDINSTIFISGCLEYVVDYSWFLKTVTKNCNKCILSYCTFDMFENIEFRQQRCWVNNLTNFKIESLFLENGFKLEYSSVLQTKDSIFVFKKNN